MLAFSNDYYGMIFRATQSVELFCAYVKRDTLSYLMLYKGKLDQIIMCLYVEVICKIQTMYVTNLRSGLEYIVKEQNDLAKDYYKKIAQPVRV